MHKTLVVTTVLAVALAVISWDMEWLYVLIFTAFVLGSLAAHWVQLVQKAPRGGD